MGFRSIVQALRQTTAGDAETIATLHRILDMPALMATLHATYNAAGAFKPVLRKRSEALSMMLDASETKKEVSPLLRHAVTCIRLHVHARDADCRRWACICADLAADPPALDLLCTLADTHTELHSVIRTAVLWTLSECNRRGATVMPYHDR